MGQRRRLGKMQAIESDTGSFSLHLTAPSAAVELAAPVLAAHLGISLGSARHRLTSSAGPIAHRLPPQAAQLLFALLSALGLNLRLRPDDDLASFGDLSIQKSVWAQPDRTARRLANVLGRDPADMDRALTQPGGLVLKDLSVGRMREIELRLASVRGLILLRSDRDSALYDIFPTRHMDLGTQGRLLAATGARLFGPDPLTGAIAAGLAATEKDRILAELPDLGLIALDRAVQRFDLYLTGVTGWVTRDLADFLVARTAQPRARFEVISPAEPILLDHGLTHDILRQFCADYAAIGLFTRPLLRGLSRFPENTIL